MRLTILGCHSPYPGANGATAGYLLQTDTVNLLLDCGSGVISQLLNYLPLPELDAVILSHYHHDHVADIGVLQYGTMLHMRMKDRTKGCLPIYGPSNPEEKGLSLSYEEFTKYHEVEEHTQLTVGDCRLTFLRTQHDIPCYAMKIQHGDKVIVYGADSGPETKWFPFVEGANLFICEGTFLEKYKPKSPTGHLSIREASEVAEEIGCGQFVVTHLFPAYKESEVRNEMKGYTRGEGHVARIGLQIEL